MTPSEREIIEHLHLRVTYLPGHYDKIFARNLYNKLSPYYELTTKQRDFMYKMLHKYRRQIMSTYKKYYPDIQKQLNL